MGWEGARKEQSQVSESMGARHLPAHSSQSLKSEVQQPSDLSQFVGPGPFGWPLLPAGQRFPDCRVFGAFGGSAPEGELDIAAARPSVCSDSVVAECLIAGEVPPEEDSIGCSSYQLPLSTRSVGHLCEARLFFSRPPCSGKS